MPIAAWGQGPGAAAGPAGAKPAVEAPVAVVPMVTGVANAEGNRDGSPEVQLGEPLTVMVANLQKWAAQTGAANDPAGAEAKDPWKLVLTLDGYPLKGVTVAAVREDAVTFRLRRTSENRDSWASLLGGHAVSKPVQVRVAAPGKAPFPVMGSPTVNLVLHRPIALVWCAVGFVGLIGVFVWMAWKSCLLRDGDTSLTTAERPFSLARSQMALWFFTILGSFVFLWLAMKDWDVLPNQAVVLFGISVATGVAAVSIDTSKRASARDELVGLQAKAALTPEETNQKAKLEASLTGQRSVNFLTDILSDAQGLSFHRFQMFAWTMVLWVMFIYSVWTALAMPEFSDQLLTFMGVSGGTYLGFKIPERKA